MNSQFRRLIPFLLAFLSALLAIIFTQTVFANDNNPEPENRVGQMSEAVVLARLQQLGYEKPTVMKVQSNDFQGVRSDRRSIPVAKYEVNTVKDGKSILLRVDRLSGKIEEAALRNQEFDKK